MQAQRHQASFFPSYLRYVEFGCEYTPLPVIKDLIGHKSVAMAELYAHHMPKTALTEWV